MWDVLGIAPTLDTRVIRKAYADRLRKLGSDPDPAQFLALRQAYECAWSSAVQPSDTGDQSEAEDTAATTERPVEPLTPEMHEAKDCVARMERATRSRDYDAAFAIFDSGLAKGVLDFKAREWLCGQIMQFIVADRSVSPQCFEGYMTHIGWETAPNIHERQSEVRWQALDRLGAEHWFAALTPAGKPVFMEGFFDDPRTFLKRRRDRIVGHALATGKMPWLMTNSLDRAFTQKLSEFGHHQLWLDDRIDQDRIGRIKRSLGRQEVWREHAFNVFEAIVVVMAAVAFLISLGTGPIGWLIARQLWRFIGSRINR